MKKYSVRLYFHSFVDVTVEAENEQEAYEEADLVVSDNTNKEINDELLGNLIQEEHDVKELTQ